MACASVVDPDTLLMVKVRDGDSRSFDLLLERNRNSVVNHLQRMVRDRAIAEELAQDVFIRIYRSRARYEATAKFTTWLFRITANVALNWRRDTRFEHAHVHLDPGSPAHTHAVLRDSQPLAEEILMRRDRAREVRSAIEELPPKQLAAVLMHKYEGMDYAQIAEALGCSVPALKSLLFRAYEHLRGRLADCA